MEGRSQIRIDEALSALRTKPIKSTTFERVQLWSSLRDTVTGLPQPLRFGEALYRFLDAVSTPVADNDLLLGRHVDKTLTAAEEQEFQAFLKDPQNLYKTTMYGTGHCTLDWANLLTAGLPGLYAQAEQSLRTVKDEGHAVFLRGALRVHEALMNFARRYAAAAREQELDDAAEAMQSLAERAPQTFREGLQLVWLINLVDCSYLTLNPTLSQGRLDVLLWPLYQADVAAGRLTEEGALELITDFYCKHNLIMGRGEHQMGSPEKTTGFTRILNFDAPQYLPLAGTDAAGRPCANALTKLFAQAIVPGFKNPIPLIRVSPHLDQEQPELWNVLMEKALQSCSMMFYNDADVKSALKQAGMAAEDVHDYEHFGCNWCSPGADSCWMLSQPRAWQFDPNITAEELAVVRVPYMRTCSEGGFPADFVAILHKAVMKPEPVNSMDELYKAFFARYRDFIKRKMEHLSKELEIRQRYPAAMLTLGSSLSHKALERAECLSATARYHFELQSIYGFGTLVDSVTAVDRLVFHEKKLTLRELVAALDANFEGYGAILALCRKSARFGSDEELSNYHAEKLSRLAVTIANEIVAPYAQKQRLLLMPAIQSDTRHLPMGAVCPATPDGRLAGEPLSQNSHPANGACRNGVTAMLSSLLHVPFSMFVSGALNLDVQPENFAGEEGRKLFGQLLGSYFNRGGLHAQVSCVGLAELREAQEHPEEHGDLLVRITGYSAIFVDLTTQMQHDVIGRMEA